MQMCFVLGKGARGLSRGERIHYHKIIFSKGHYEGCPWTMPITIKVFSLTFLNFYAMSNIPLLFQKPKFQMCIILAFLQKIDYYKIRFLVCASSMSNFLAQSNISLLHVLPKKIHNFDFNKICPSLDNNIFFQEIRYHSNKVMSHPW